MAKIGSLTGKDGLNVYPGTIPQAVIDPSTKKNIRTELNELYEESVVMEDDSEEADVVETVAADTATKALQDWDGNDIRTTYLKDAPKDGNQYVRNNGAWEQVEVPDAVTVDSSMSDSSTNPVQNKVVKAYSDNNLSTAKTYAKTYADGLFKVVTEAEYTALGSTVNSDGVIYFITE